MTEVVVYTKKGCHLCERVLEKLKELNSAKSVKISTQDITQSRELFERYKNLIPVVAVDGKVRLAGVAMTNLNAMEEILRRTVFSD